MLLLSDLDLEDLYRTHVHLSQVDYCDYIVKREYKWKLIAVSELEPWSGQLQGARKLHCKH